MNVSVRETTTENIAESAEVALSSGAQAPWHSRFSSIFRRNIDNLSGVVEDYSGEDDRASQSRHRERSGVMKRLRPDMIRRMDAPPKPVNPSGWITEGHVVPVKGSSARMDGEDGANSHVEERSSSPSQSVIVGELSRTPQRIHSELMSESDTTNKGVETESPVGGQP